MSNPLDKTLEPETGAETIWAKAADWLMDRRVSEDWSAVDQAALDAWLSESNQHLVSLLAAGSGVGSHASFGGAAHARLAGSNG